ncbi:MAG: hypothetical protein AB7I33_03610 [Gemmatimonadales bacterium]
MPMDIMVPDQKDPLPQRGNPLLGVLRAGGTMGFVAFVVLFAMVFSEGEVRFPHLQLVVELSTLALAGFVISWWRPRLGGAIMALGMIGALFVTPIRLLDWRPYFFAFEGLLSLVGVLLVALRLVRR